MAVFKATAQLYGYGKVVYKKVFLNLFGDEIKSSPIQFSQKYTLAGHGQGQVAMMMGY